MSAFHPAVRGILFAALTEHEQAHALAQLAADKTSAAAIDRYREVIDGLNRLVALTEPDVYSRMPIEGIEKMQNRHVLLGRLISQLSDYEISSWNVRRDAVDGMLHSIHGGDRDSIHAIADLLGVEFTERPNGGKAEIAAAGRIDGADVRIWSILNEPYEAAAEPVDLGPMHCMLHSTPAIPPGEKCPECAADFQAADEALAQDEDQPATPARGHGQDVEHFDQAEVDDVLAIRREMAIEAGDDSEALRQEAEDDAHAERKYLAGITTSLDTTPLAVAFGAPGAHLATADENDVDDEDDGYVLDYDEPVSHAPTLDGTTRPRCNAGEDDPVYSNRPTCPTCRSLIRAQRRAATPPATSTEVTP